MEGINLSRSMQSDEQPSKTEALLDRGMTGALAIFLLVAAAWGGLMWYSSSLDQKIASANQSLATGSAGLVGKKADRASDFFDRSMIVKKDLPTAIYPDKELEKVEAVTVPGVVLVGYQYDGEGGMVSVSGTTDNFRYLAQQLLAMTLSGDFTMPKVDDVSRTKEGKIKFTILASVSSVPMQNQQ